MYPDKSIPLEELVNGTVYELVSRNLAVGVWVEKRLGFIGIREKFNSRYLFMEFEYNTNGRYGSAMATKDTGVAVPTEIPLKEDLDTLCLTHQTPIIWGKELKGWVHVKDGTVCLEPNPQYFSNQKLFDFLEVLDKPVREANRKLFEEKLEKIGTEMEDIENFNIT